MPKWFHFEDGARKDGGMRKPLLSVLLVGLLPGLLSACVTHAETVAEHFDRQMKAFAKDCAKTTPRPGSTSCDRLKLKPADPLATEEGRFAHSIKIPNPVSADSGYKPGMTSRRVLRPSLQNRGGGVHLQNGGECRRSLYDAAQKRSDGLRTGASVCVGRSIWT